MTLIRYKNQIEYAFIIWMSNYPDSYHWADMQRFYTFVKTVARYRSTKWRQYDYFRQQVLTRKPHFAADDIEKFHDIMMKCLEFYKAPYIDTINHSEDGGYGYKQVGVKNGEIYEIDITESEWLHNGRKV